MNSSYDSKEENMFCLKFCGCHQYILTNTEHISISSPSASFVFTFPVHVVFVRSLRSRSNTSGLIFSSIYCLHTMNIWCGTRSKFLSLTKAWLSNWIWCFGLIYGSSCDDLLCYFLFMLHLILKSSYIESLLFFCSLVFITCQKC